MKKILVTGGTGYIGSHTVVELQAQGFECLIVDNLSNSRIETLEGIEKISGKRPEFVKLDLRDKKSVFEFFAGNKDIEAVIHFAAAKAVGESVTDPLKYYENNVVSTVNLLQAMQENKINNIIFSSTAAVYGKPEEMPVSEETPIQEACSPYGNAKIIVEEIIRDVAVSDKNFKSILLRYFNAAGAHDSGLVGEVPSGIPANLIPFITQTAIGARDELKVFGNDYDTKDGYGVRDYIHVVDLAKAHVASLQRMISGDIEKNLEIYNLGTGQGNSVKEVIDLFEKISGTKLKYSVTDRRTGDIAEIYAKTDLANEKLNWKAEKNIKDMLRSAWEWEKALRAGEK